MHLPEGNRIDGKVCKLKRCIYGLKQSPREWYGRLTSYLIPYGFSIATFDPCVLLHDSGSFFLAMYVDDITLFGSNDNPLMDDVKKILKREFKVTDLGNLHWILGIKIDFTPSGITLSQRAYIEKILSRFGMENCHAVSTPIDPKHRLQASKPEDRLESDEISTYQQMIGSLMYAVTGTRPDLAYTVSHLSQFSSSPNHVHQSAVKRVLRFLRGSTDYSLIYKYNQPLAIEAFSDASLGNCLDTRRSFWGYITQLGTATITWRSRRQRSVATSSVEAEYMALSMTAKHMIWLQQGLKEILRVDIPSVIYTDNTGAQEIAENHKINDRTAHIDRHYHFVRERIEAGDITVLHIDGKKNPADICTKGLPRAHLDVLNPLIFGQPIQPTTQLIDNEAEKGC